MIAGKDDHVWDSAGMVAEAAERLKHARFTYPVDIAIYSRAGHTAGRPEIVPEWTGQLHHPVSGKPVIRGGTPEGNALSSLDAPAKVLRFLEASLAQPSSSAK